MKFIHLTDTHVVGGDRLLYGANPARRLGLAVDSINAEHADAAFVVVTGDMTNWGEADEYRAFHQQISRLRMPVHLMVGNHDDTQAFADQFPDVPREAGGFVQYAFDTPQGRAICLDTKHAQTHAGHLCEDRLTWLRAELAHNDAPVFLFMHHPPFPVGIAGMDEIMMLEAEALYDVLAPHVNRIRHLFFGHVHRPIFGNWRGISFSCMRGLNHQVALDLSGDPATIPGNFEQPAYGVVLAQAGQVTIHMHEFANGSPRFCLNGPADQDPVRYQTDLRHEGFTDL